MRWLIPREHGAYGQIGFPLAAGLAAGRPGTAAWLLVLGFAAAFVAHEPVLVLLGDRGPRAKRESYRDGVRTLLVAGTIAVMAGVAGLLLMPRAARWTVAVPAAFALAAVPLVAQKQQKTTTGELHVALTLASCALPVGVAARVGPQAAATIWFVLTLGFWAATLAVRATIANQRREPHAALRGWAIVLAAAGPAVTALLAATFGLSTWLWTAALPLSALAAASAIALPHARHLRQIGWALIAASVVATVALVATLRGAGL